MHEDFGRAEETKSSSNRTFGLVMGGFLLIVALLPLLHQPHTEVRWWALGIGLAFGALGLVRPDALGPLNRLWMRLGLLLYHVVSPITLGLLFYAIVTPVGLLMRACGKDPLRLRLDRAAASYWLPREPPGPSAESMKHQF